MLMSTPLQVKKAEDEVVKMELKRKQLLIANKAAARLLLIGLVSEGSGDDSRVVRHNWNGK